MSKNFTKYMPPEDERQYMLDDRFEIYEKHGAPIGATGIHYHNFYELIYVMEGEFSSFIENTTYNLNKGDFLLIDQNVMHRYHYVEKKHDHSRRIVLWIKRDMLRQMSSEDVDLSRCFTEKGSGAYHFPIYYEEMLRGMLMKIALADSPELMHIKGKKLLDKSYLTLFFVYLNELCCREEFYFSEEELVSHPLVKEVSDYVDCHVEETISVDQLACHVNMSKYHFLRRFKELTGMTVHSFINNKRLILACEKIRRNCPITQAYQSAGFTDYSSFYRNFRSVYGLSPKDYRKYYIHGEGTD